ARDDELEIADLRHEGIRLRVARSRLLEVGAHAAPERGGLADVDDLALGVLVEVDAGPVGKPGEFVGEIDRGYGPSHSVTTSTASPTAAAGRTLHRNMRSTPRSSRARW